MAFGLTIGTERATALQTSIQDELMKRGYSPDADPVMAEYITIMIINNKTPAQITLELEDLIGSDFDSSFVDWLFTEAAKGAPVSDAPTAEASTSAQPTVRDSPPHTGDNARRPPIGPRSSAPLYQQALSQALPSPTPSAQKRTASARSPSPTGHANKSRRTDLPTGPRAMLRDSGVAQQGGGGGGGNTRSLLDRMGPARGGNTPFGQDDIQARIDNITGGSPDPNMMMMGPGFPMNGMNGMDMAAMGMTNPMLLQEMMMNQMALMAQMAGAMGIMGPNAGQFMNGGFPMQPDMAMFNGGMNGMQPMGGMEGGGGRGRGRGRGGSRGAGRGRGGAHNVAHQEITSEASPAPAPAPAPAAPTPVNPVVAPTPVLAAAAVPPVSVSPAAATAAQSRSGFVPPERPQSPTLCKFGLKCTNPVCRYSHPSPVATLESGVVLSNEACENGKNCKDKDCIKAHVSPAVLNPNAVEHMKPNAYVSPPPPIAHSHSHSQTPCRYGLNCTRPNCTFSHPPRPSSASSTTPCKFGAACTRATCPFQHPPGRVLPSTFHRGLSTSGPIVSVLTPDTGSMGGQSQNKSVTFNRPAGAKSAAELEQKLKEMEEKKSQAEKAVAQAEAAAAAGKDDATKSVAISA
ncbi:hypothetical protein WOLCODRAFT_139985 [Wolfiporia cocos MD-104 SS10]|uniref:Nab2 type CCCH zinc finger 4 domain-containing protein n=1 Tax=Wolfiporia cocos (strain MD-104) TaxID=742152 RepID=A0A2H3J1Q7_WOLCO|nr:hypothetical protein WOLCODRAFT_139985 [Wolfiporia cocos MD-104 SS10]